MNDAPSFTIRAATANDRPVVVKFLVDAWGPDLRFFARSKQGKDAVLQEQRGATGSVRLSR